MPFPEAPGQADAVARLALRAELLDLMIGLDVPEMAAARAFTQQVIRCNDPDAVAGFLKWRDDPRLESVLQLASALDDDALDQLVFCAEDLYADGLRDGSLQDRNTTSDDLPQTPPEDY